MLVLLRKVDYILRSCYDNDVPKYVKANIVELRKLEL